MKRRDVILVALAVLGLVGAAYLTGHRRGAKSNANAKTDTVVVWRTKYEDRPQFKTEELIEFRPVSYNYSLPVFIESTDTVEKLVPYIKDSLIYVPITQKYFERDDGHLRLWISGYDTSLDRWELDEQTVTVTKRKRWGFSAGAGPAVIVSPFGGFHVDAGVGVFAGVTYTF